MLRWVYFFPRGTARALALAVTFASAALAPNHVALAQENPLIGVWSTSSVDSRGRVVQVAYLQFSPNGALVMKGVKTGLAQNTPVTETGQYQILQGGSTVQMVFTDYQPKQCAQIPTVVPGAPTAACEPPLININQAIVRGFQLQEPDYLVFSDGAVYVKQPGFPTGVVTEFRRRWEPPGCSVPWVDKFASAATGSRTPANAGAKMVNFAAVGVGGHGWQRWRQYLVTSW